jgi:dihydroneopterin aldolase
VRVMVTVDKPHALRFADSVSVTLEHETSLE